jgi:hypothetical protein
MASDRVEEILLIVQSSPEIAAKTENYSPNCWNVSSHSQNSNGKIEGR